MNVNQRRYFKFNLAEQEAYWQQQLGSELPVSQVPLDYPRAIVQSFIKRTEAVELDEELCLELKQFCARENVTLFITLLATFKVILLRYTGQEDIIVGSLSADSLRKREGVGREEFVKGASQFCKYIKWKVDH